MRKQDRLAEPEILLNGKRDWNAAWVTNANEGKAWRWPVKDGIPLNQHILPLLTSQSSSHCSFCDGYPLEARSPETIEHFKPKAKNHFPELAFEWDNLFYCCTRCQKYKGENFDPLLLKPDEQNYQFTKYFICDYTSGNIRPNPHAGLLDQRRAEITIQIYGLNSGSLPGERLRWIGFWQNDNTGASLDEFSFRDFIQ